MKSLDDLAKIKESMREVLDIRNGKPSLTKQTHIMMCGGQGCISSRCMEIVDALKESLARNGMTELVKIILTGCIGPCDMGPVAIVYPDATFYRKLKPKDAEAIVEEHIMKGALVTACYTERRVQKNLRRACMT